MYRLIVSLLLVLTFSSNAKDKIVACVGDSNTQRGYPKTLQEQLGKGWQTVNCGIGAATVIDGTFRPYHKMKQYQKALSSNANYIIIMLGTNDANPRWWTKDRKTDFKGSLEEEFKANYLKLIEILSALKSKPTIILAVPLPIFPDKAPQKNKKNTNGRKANFNKCMVPIIKAIAKEKKLALVNIQELLANDESLSTDGVHFNKAGYTKMSQAFAEKLKALSAK
jgi:lysophospholipase L1-like esterase